MFAGLLLLTIGCTLRVSSEVLAYQGYANWAWSVLPISALLELAGITAFATNISRHFHSRGRNIVQKQLLGRGNRVGMLERILRSMKGKMQGLPEKAAKVHLPLPLRNITSIEGSRIH